MQLEQPESVDSQKTKWMAGRVRPDGRAGQSVSFSSSSSDRRPWVSCRRRHRQAALESFRTATAQLRRQPPRREALSTISQVIGGGSVAGTQRARAAQPHQPLPSTWRASASSSKSRTNTALRRFHTPTTVQHGFAGSLILNARERVGQLGSARPSRSADERALATSALADRSGVSVCASLQQGRRAPWINDEGQREESERRGERKRRERGNAMPALDRNKGPSARGLRVEGWRALGPR